MVSSKSAFLAHHTRGFFSHSLYADPYEVRISCPAGMRRLLVRLKRDVNLALRRACAWGVVVFENRAAVEFVRRASLH